MTALPWLAFLSHSIGKTCLQSYAHAYCFFSCWNSWTRYKGEKKLSNKFSVFIILQQAESVASAQDEASHTGRNSTSPWIFPLIFLQFQTLTLVLEMLVSNFWMLPQLVFSNQDLQYMNISLFPTRWRSSLLFLVFTLNAFFYSYSGQTLQKVMLYNWKFICYPLYPGLCIHSTGVPRGKHSMACSSDTLK